MSPDPSIQRHPELGSPKVSEGEVLLTHRRPASLTISDLSRKTTLLALEVLFRGQGSRLHEEILEGLTKAEGISPAQLIRTNPTPADITLTSATTYRQRAGELVSAAQCRHSVDSAESFLRCFISFDPIAGTYTLELCWENNLTEFYGLEPDYWTLIEGFLSETMPKGAPADLRTRSIPHSRAREYLVEDNWLVKLDGLLDPGKKLLSDPHLSVHPELLTFVVGQVDVPEEPRIYHLTARIFGSYSARIETCLTEFEGCSLQEGFENLQRKMARTPRLDFCFLVRDGIVYPVTRATTWEALSQDIPVITRLREERFQSRNNKLDQLPVTAVIQVFAPNEIAKTLSAYGINVSSLSAARIREFLLEGEELDRDVVKNFFPNEAYHIECGETVVAPVMQAAGIHRYLEFKPIGSPHAPIVRIYAEPIYEESDDPDGDETDPESEVFEDELDLSPDQDEEDDEDEREIELLNPLKIITRIDWPVSQIGPISEQALLQRWKLIDGVLARHALNLPNDLKSVPRDDENYFVLQIAEGVSVQMCGNIITRTPNLEG